MSSFHAEVWKTFRGIQTRDLKQKNNNAEYITWSKIWDLVMNNYPQSNYEFTREDILTVGDNGPANTVMVTCRLTIVENATRPRKAVRLMHLPVMASFGQFLAIENPSARQISDAYMRALVKAAAMFGLGLSLWSGDEFVAVDKQQERILTFAKKKSDWRRRLWETAIVIKDAFIADDQSAGLEAWDECSEDEKRDLWLAETKGGFFTMKEKEWIQSWRIMTDQ